MCDVWGGQRRCVYLEKYVGRAIERYVNTKYKVFIHFFCKYLLNTYHVLGRSLGMQTKLLTIYIWMKETENKQ